MLQDMIKCIKSPKKAQVLIVSNKNTVVVDNGDDGEWRNDKSGKTCVKWFLILGNVARNALWIIQTSWWRIWRIKHLNFL